jgi:hypothetical protein
MAVRSLKDLPQDLNKKISRDFNNLVKDVHSELSSEQNMPVWTGFFASSWKASNTPVSATHNIMDYQPWASIKQEVFEGFKLTRESRKPDAPVVQPRFPVGEGERIFNYRKGVFIGNKANYSQYVLETGEIQDFVQGQLGRLIKENMSDKGKIFIGGKLSDKRAGTTYTGFEA